MPKMNSQWLLLLLIAPFVKGCVFPGWSSALELALACTLVGFLTWFAPRKTSAEAKVEDLQEQLASLQEQFRTLNLRLGFSRQVG